MCEDGHICIEVFKINFFYARSRPTTCNTNTDIYLLIRIIYISNIFYFYMIELI